MDILELFYSYIIASLFQECFRLTKAIQIYIYYNNNTITESIISIQSIQHSKSLYKFAKLSENNSRLRDVLCMFLNYYVDEKLKNQLCKRFLYLNEVCDQLNGVAVEDLPLGEDRTIYENYLNKKYTKTMINSNPLCKKGSLQFKQKKAFPIITFIEPLS